ncbi:MAG: hypothetical protein IJ702_03025 [Fretibacterium sp.]|nr:hypothetical protein [Fretibacterium sp.]
MEVRFFRITERELLLDSIKKLWSENHIYVRNPAVLEHLVLNTPYRAAFAGEENYSFLGAWDQGEVVGLQGIIPQEANLAGERGLSSTGTVWVVTPRARKEGIGLLFMRFFEQGGRDMQVSIGLSPTSYGIYKLLNNLVLEDLPRWIAVNRVRETVENLLPNDGALPYLPRVTPRELRTNYKIQVDALDAEKWDAFYSGRFAPMTIGTCRDDKFLRWRYMESPVLRYHFLTLCDEAGSYHGLAVVRIEPILNGRFTIGRILEFIAVEAEASVALANAVVNFDRDVLMWDFYCLSDITAFGLEAVGFRRLPAWMDHVMMPTRFQPVDYEQLKLNVAIWLSERARKKLEPLNSSQWYITKGDADQDRAN